MNEPAGQALRDVFPSADLAIWFAGTLLVAWLLQLSIHMRAKSPRAAPWVKWADGVAFPLFVLALTLTTSSFVSVEEAGARLQSAWVVFWSIVLAVRVLDQTAELLHRRRKRPFPIPPLLHRTLLALVYAAAALGVLRVLLDVNVTPLLATSAVLTMVLGLALQGVLGNLLAGMSLDLVRAIEVGDQIRVNDTEGMVVHTNWRETIILTSDEDFVRVPNSTMASEHVTNFHKPERLHRHHMDVHVGFAHPAAEVIAALERAGRESGSVVAEPSPRAVVFAYLDYGVKYRLYFWSEDYGQEEYIAGEVGRHVWYKLKRGGFEIPFPVSEARLGGLLRSAAPSAPDEPRIAETLRTSEFLSRVENGERKPLLTEDEVTELARHCRLVRYTRGEILARQGDPGEVCYVVVRGAVQGSVSYVDQGTTHTLDFATGPGQVFGEMSLLTGAPRTATGRFEDEALLVEIPREAFARFLASREEVVQEIASRTAERNRANAEFLKKIENLDPQVVAKSQDSGAIVTWLKGLAALGKRLLGS